RPGTGFSSTRWVGCCWCPGDFTARSPCGRWPSLGKGRALRSEPGRPGLGPLGRVPARAGIERLERAAAVDVDQGIELACDPGVEVVALALGAGPVDDADRALEQRVGEGGGHARLVAQRQQ